MGQLTVYTDMKRSKTAPTVTTVSRLGESARVLSQLLNLPFRTIAVKACSFARFSLKLVFWPLQTG